MRNLLVFVLISVVAFCYSCAFAAGLEVNITSGSNQTYNTGYGGETTFGGASWTITGSTDGTETISIKAAAADTWYYGTQVSTSTPYPNIVNTYLLKLNSSGGTAITSSDLSLGTFSSTSDVPSGLPHNYSFGLYFKAPLSPTADASKTITVTLTASAWVGLGNTTAHGFTGCTGELVETGNIVMCKYTGTNLSCPAGWTQYLNWQQYSQADITTGDGCGNWKGQGTTTWANTASVCRGPTVGTQWSTCQWCSVDNSDGWYVTGGSPTCWHSSTYTCNDISNYRTAIGCY